MEREREGRERGRIHLKFIRYRRGVECKTVVYLDWHNLCSMSSFSFWTIVACRFGWRKISTILHNTYQTNREIWQQMMLPISFWCWLIQTRTYTHIQKGMENVMHLDLHSAMHYIYHFHISPQFDVDDCLINCNRQF